MKRGIKLFFIILMVFLISSQYKASGEDSPLVAEMKGFLVKKNEEGREILIDTNEILPGQTIEYRLKYTNKSKEDIKNIKIVGPVPENTKYIAGSATKDEKMIPEYSIDNGITFMLEPVRYMKTLPDGTKNETTATPDMYTHVRWSLPALSGGSFVEYCYRVIVK